MSTQGEPHFSLEALSRWDFGWRLTQTTGRILLPIPQDFHTTVEAIHHAKRLSDPYGCTLTVKIAPGWHDGDEKEKLIEIRHPALRPEKTAAH